MSIFNLYVLVILGFALVDFLYVHFVKAAPGSLWDSIMKFFVDVNAKALTAVNTVFNEIISNFHEYGMLIVVFFVGGPQLFVQVLAGYLGLRITPDILSVFKK